MGQRKRVALETEPHGYEVDLGRERGGVVELLFQPEVMGAEFVDAQAELRDEQARVQNETDRRKQAVLADAALRRFLAEFMLPDSAKAFVTFDKTSKIIKEKMALPDWVLNDMTQWVVEVYGRRPTGSSSDSAPPPQPAGKPSTGSSRSKALTRKGGR